MCLGKGTVDQPQNQSCLHVYKTLLLPWLLSNNRFFSASDTIGFFKRFYTIQQFFDIYIYTQICLQS